VYKKHYHQQGSNGEDDGSTSSEPNLKVFSTCYTLGHVSDAKVKFTTLIFDAHVK